MKIITKTLQKALDAIGDVPNKRSSIPILNCYKIEAKHNQLTVSASNLDAHANYVMECEGELAPVCVSAGLFRGLIQQASESVTLEMNGPKLGVASQGKAMLPIIKADDFPAFPVTKDKALGLSLIDLAELIDGVAWACEPNSGDSFKENIHVLALPKALRVSGFRRTVFCHGNRPLLCAESEFMFPAVFAGLVTSAMREEMAVLWVTENHVIVGSNTLSIAVKKAELNFYKMEMLDEVLKPVSSIGNLEVSELETAFSAASILCDSTILNSVKIEPSESGINIVYAGQNEYNGTISQGKYEFEPFSIQVPLVREALRKLQGGMAQVKVALCAQGLVFTHGDFITSIGFVWTK